MSAFVTVKTYAAPPIDEKEILRYSGCRNVGDEVRSLMHSAVDEAKDRLVYKVCFTELPVEINGSLCDFGLFGAESEGLAKNLSGCGSVVIFAATVGMELDRLIYRYSRLSPSRALMMQAIGAERIEALCGTFCDEIGRGRHLKPRFSPGYGDLSLDVQKDIAAILDCSKNIGISLNESMLMSPSKSVTAFVGITDKITDTKKCDLCDKIDCSFRSTT